MNKLLRKRLLQMARADQAMRRGGKWNKEVDKCNAEKLKQIIRRYGWPDISLVGKRGAKAAWLIAQHADFDVRLQIRFLRLLQKSVHDGNAPAWQYAYLVDRVRLNSGRPQLYGTQFRTNKRGTLQLWPVQNRKQLAARRLRMGLEPLTRYRRRIFARFSK